MPAGAHVGPTSPTPPRHAVLIAGSGRSGTSTMAGILQRLGMHVPGPEIEPNESNPEGFAESKWVVSFHNTLLQRVLVQVSDARPQAGETAGKAALRSPPRLRLATWLERQLEARPELVIKDPRLTWFLEAWAAAAAEAGARVSCVTMVRHPAEVVGSKHTYYDARRPVSNSVAAWVNTMIHTEQATRNLPRAFVRYEDLLSGWRPTVRRLGSELGVGAVRQATPEAIARVDNFVDPSLRRVRWTWGSLEVPDRLRSIAEATWDQLNVLAAPGGDAPSAHAALDRVGEDYRRFYAEAEDVAVSSVVAARRRGQRQALAEAEPTLQGEGRDRASRSGQVTPVS